MMRALLLAMACAAVLASPAAAAVSDGTITSGGPLTVVRTTADLNCAVNHAGDSAGEFYGETACGTLVAVDGTLYGPASIPAGSGANPHTAWTPESQTGSGSGTAVDPYRVVTTVTGGGLSLVQTDTYVVGSESYGTRVAITNTTGAAKTITLYRAGDCYLQDSDAGYGASEGSSGAVACTAGTDPGSRIEQWAPITSGSHYFESGYNNVWARIGSQQPFGDTCDCSTNQDNGAGLSWTATVPAGSTSSFSHLTAFSPTGQQVTDSDGDGFPDTWETSDGGVDTNGDGTPDLKLSDYGATPDKPDVFVQVGWTKTRSCFLFFFCSTRNRRPSLAALRDGQDAFKAHGIRLHIDAGSGSLMNPDNGATWGSRSHVGDGIDAPSRIPGIGSDGSFDWSEAFDGYRNQLLPDERKRLFHFAMYVGSFDDAGHSGVSRSNASSAFAGRDFIFAHDVFHGGPTRIEESGTFMHELGHNLGLSHGGSVAEQAVNNKPNYPSIMNYTWQMSGTFKHDHLGLLDYSEGTLNPLDEHNLSESTGLEPDTAASDIGTRWACPDGNLHPTAPSASNVDWNCNGSTDTGTFGQNVTDGSDLTVLHDQDDWHSLVFDGGGALGGAGDAANAPRTSPPEEPATAEQLVAVAGDLHTVEFDGPGQLSIQAHTSAPVKLVITNHHDQQRSYDLAVTTSGVTLTGIPPNVTLAAGETRTLSPTLTAGPANDAAFFEVDASSDDATDADSVVTEVFAVNQVVLDQPGQQHPTQQQPTQQQPMPIHDTVPPKLKGLRLVPKRFRATGTKGKVTGKTKKHPARGSKIKLDLSEPSVVTFLIVRPRGGRRVGNTCRKPTKSNRSKKRCTRYTVVGNLERALGQGARSVSFTGRIRGKAMPYGRYLIVATAVDAAKNKGAPRVAKFRIVHK